MQPQDDLHLNPPDSGMAARPRANDWLAALLMKRPAGWLGRFALYRRQLSLLSRPKARWLKQRAAVSLTAAAMLLALAAGPFAPRAVHAATITVANGEIVIDDNGLCSLNEAIINANDGAVYDDCIAGAPGTDTIVLPVNGTFTLGASFGYAYNAETGLPLIRSRIVVQGNNSTIERDGSADPFRLMAVTGSGDLTLQNVNLRGGYIDDDNFYRPKGGAIHARGDLSISGGTISDNYADEGGAIYVAGGDLTISNVTFERNETDEGGGAITVDRGDVLITGSTFTDNVVLDGDGGAIDHDDGRFELRDSLLSGNTAGNISNINESYGDGGAVYLDNSVATIENVTFTENHAAARGGALYQDNGKLAINNSRFYDNKAGASGVEEFSSYYGYPSSVPGIFRREGARDGSGGAVYSDSGVLTITGSTLTGNRAYEEGGAIFIDDSAATITGSTITGNTADGFFLDTFIPDDTNLDEIVFVDDIYGYGGGLFVDSATVTVQDSLISGNEATLSGGGVYAQYGRLTLLETRLTGNEAGTWGGGGATGNADLIINRSLVSGNRAYEGGGGGLATVVSPDYYNNTEEPTLIVTNSTISGNSAPTGAGILHNSGVTRLRNVTVTDNEDDGIAATEDGLSIARSLVSGNTSDDQAEVRALYGATILANNFNLFGHGGLSDATAFENFAPGASDLNATSDGINLALASILNTALASNGGPTQTHALPAGSAAIDAAPSTECVPAPTSNVDQRGAARNADGNGVPSSDECDIGAYEAEGTPPPTGDAMLYVTASGGTANNDSEPDVPYQKGDILKWDGTQWSKWFDGTDNGLVGTADLIAIDVIDDGAGSAYLVWRQNVNVPGIGRVVPWEVVRFNGSTFERFFDGRDVGLSTSGERINGLSVLDGVYSPVGSSCDAYLLITTMAGGAVRNGSNPVVRFSGEDVLGFCLTQPGGTTAGVWNETLVFEGESNGMTKNSGLGLASTGDATRLYMTSKSNFPAAFNKVLPFDLPGGPFGTAIADTAALGVSQTVDSIDVTE